MQRPTHNPRRSIAFWKKSAFAGVVFLTFFALLEGVLALCGVSTRTVSEDPFVGFAGHSPLFVRRTSSAGGCIMQTARRKLDWFNEQQFPCTKGSGTKRIFTLGGSTTYGRPYDDRTSFSGWLREFLREADAGRRWEVINAGGISYASYRVARIVDEVLQYEPDLLIIYTGHNEFLERRTYGHLAEMPQFVRDSGELLGRLRTTALLGRLMQHQRADKGARPELPDDVQPILEQTVGPEAYHRDDELRSDVLEHFRYNLQRMVETARSRGVEVILVTPAANLRDCSPFKSEHAGGARAELAAADAALEAARTAREAGRLEEALHEAERCLEIDGRYAAAHYLRGRVLDEMGLHEKARAAYERALDEDVCPLRAVTEIVDAVRDVAAQTNTPVVDFAGWTGSFESAPGSDWFLDHVHPTIEGHRRLALQLFGAMKTHGLLPAGAELGDERIAAVTQRIEQAIDPRDHAIALRNLSKVLGWAGKVEEADRLALKAVDMLGDDAEARFQAGAALFRSGDFEAAMNEFRQALKIDPRHPRAHYGIGLIYAETGKPNEAIREYRLSLEADANVSATHFNLARMYEAVGEMGAAEAHYRRALEINPDDVDAWNNLALVLARQGSLDEARPLFERALQIQPDFADALSNLGQLWLLQGDRDRAVEYIRRALEVAPDHPQARTIWKQLNSPQEKGAPAR